MTIKISREKPLKDSEYFKLVNPHRPRIYRQLSGYCNPMMYVDPKGLRIYREEGSMMVRNSQMATVNTDIDDIIAVIPVSQVTALYTAMQMALKDEGLLDDNNQIKEDPDDEGDTGSGYVEPFIKHGLRL